MRYFLKCIILPIFIAFLFIAQWAMNKNPNLPSERQFIKSILYEKAQTSPERVALTPAEEEYLLVALGVACLLICSTLVVFVAKNQGEGDLSPSCLIATRTLVSSLFVGTNFELKKCLHHG